MVIERMLNSRPAKLIGSGKTFAGTSGLLLTAYGADVYATGTGINKFGISAEGDLAAKTYIQQHGFEGWALAYGVAAVALIGGVSAFRYIAHETRETHPVTSQILKIGSVAAILGVAAYPAYGALSWNGIAYHL